MPQADAAERLLNLIIALSHARGRMTRAEIRATVAGYDPERGGDSPAEARKRTAAFERMFERDKEDLRRIGVPLRTVVDATHGDDIGYVIDAGEASMPPIDLSPVERAILAVAAEYWQSAALGTDARRAFVKLSSSMPRVEEVPVHLAARSTEGAESAPALAQAIADGQAVAFLYTSAASGRGERTGSSPGGSSCAAGACTSSGGTSIGTRRGRIASAGSRARSARWGRGARSSRPTT